MTSEGATRREFVAAASGAAVATMLPGRAGASGARRRYAIVGTGVRGIGMWGRPLVERYADVLEFVGLSDINPLRVEDAKKTIGVDCPTFTNLDQMLDQAKPELLMVTTVDASHAECIVKALDRGIDVLTEKPMVIDEAQCQAVLDAEKRSGRKLNVTFNYRYAPKHQTMKEILLSGEIGRDLGGLLVVPQHEPRRRLLPPLAPPHLEERLALGAQGEPPLRPRQLVARRRPGGGLGLREPPHYGKKGKFHHTNCRPCPHKASCAYHWDIMRDPRLVALYVDCEKADGYLRDGCVFKEDVDIPDTMNAIVQYSNGVHMSYSVNAFMPIEGYRIAFNGTEGRLEVRDYERQLWPSPRRRRCTSSATSASGGRWSCRRRAGGHGGGDDVLRDLLFRSIDLPPYMRLPTSRAGAMSCLTGIAARKSMNAATR